MKCILPTGVQMEAETRRIYHPHGLFIDWRGRFDMLVMDVKLLPELLVPCLEELPISAHQADSDHEEREEKLTIGRPSRNPLEGYYHGNVSRRSTPISGMWTLSVDSDGPYYILADAPDAVEIK